MLPVISFKIIYYEKGGTMKRTAVICLIIVFLSCQFSYATNPSGNVMPSEQENQELTQEEIKEIVIGLLRSIGKVLVDRESIDLEEFIKKVEDTQGADPLLNQSACSACLYSIGMLLTGLYLIQDGGAAAIIGLFVLAFNMGYLLHMIPYCQLCFFP